MYTRTRKAIDWIYHFPVQFKGSFLHIYNLYWFCQIYYNIKQQYIYIMWIQHTTAVEYHHWKLNRTPSVSNSLSVPTLQKHSLKNIMFAFANKSITKAKKCDIIFLFFFLYYKINIVSLCCSHSLLKPIFFFC